MEASMEPKTLEVRFPLSGVVRRLGHWGDPANAEKPFTPWAVNCRPEDVLEHRLRGGSRPGLLPYVYDSEPQWPDPALLDEDDDPITNEGGEDLDLPLTGASSLYPQIFEALEAYGYGDIPTGEDWSSSSGTAPTGTTLGCRYRDRLVLAGEGLVYMSRQSEYGDWNYGADVQDMGRAVVLPLSEAGEIGENVTALIPHKDSFLMMATTNGLWVLNGDPTDGSMSNVSRNVGIISEHAWTKADDTFFFLTPDGLYAVNADGSGLKPLSDRLPWKLEDLDVNNYTVMMGYSHDQGGIYIFIEGDEYHWFFDMEEGGFWPFNLPVTVSSTFIVDGVLLVKDSSDNLWTLDGEDDNGTDVESHVLFGPFRIQEAPHFSPLITSMSGALDIEPSGSVTWRIVHGDTAQQVVERATDAVDNYIDGDTTTAVTYVRASGTWSEGRTHTSHPRVRAGWIVVWLSSTDVWAFDDLLIEIMPAGKWR